MKKTLLSLTLLAAFHFCSGQVVPSSCNAADSIIAMYNTDADRLTVRKFYEENLTYKDSINIPQEHADTILDALIAVYNATSLAARDTVVTIYELHSFPDIDLHRFYVYADSTLAWMQQIRNGISPTGNSAIDSLSNLYYLNVYNYSTFVIPPQTQTHTVCFLSDSNYNILPLSKVYETLPGVQTTEVSGWVGGGQDITATIYSNYVELIYSYSWGDCPSGCLYSRYWEFKVFYDCSVEFIGSYGSSLTTVTDKAIQKPSTAVFPNPFSSYIYTKGASAYYDYVLYDIRGKEITRGKVRNHQTITLDGLPLGQYLLQLKTDQEVTHHRLIKE